MPDTFAQLSHDGLLLRHHWITWRTTFWRMEMGKNAMEWKKHYVRAGTFVYSEDKEPNHDDAVGHRKKIEPWLSALFQSEHLSLLLGSGFTNGVAVACGIKSVLMEQVKFGSELDDEITDHAKKLAKRSGRSTPNLEDQLQAAMSLSLGLDILKDKRKNEIDATIKARLQILVEEIAAQERAIDSSIQSEEPDSSIGSLLLGGFINSFASRVATRERLNIFTTNYDRLIEYGCDILALRILDRFVGALSPIFRASRVDVDVHYSPPGIRGEPRYLEGVVRLSKLHGSLDWVKEGRNLIRTSLPFGPSAEQTKHNLGGAESAVIYPYSGKELDTTHYPFSELLRDFATVYARPQSTLVTYGYGFGDEHINRVIGDALTIPSTHLLIITFDDAGGRVTRFLDSVNKPSQISVLYGPHFGSIENLVRYYLPKPALDQITWKLAGLLEKRGVKTPVDDSDVEDAATPPKKDLVVADQMPVDEGQGE